MFAGSALTFAVRAFYNSIHLRAITARLAHLLGILILARTAGYCLSKYTVTSASSRGEADEENRKMPTLLVVRRRHVKSMLLHSARHLSFRSALLIFCSLAILAASSGKSVKMISSWFNPIYKGHAFHKILVIGVAENPEVRADFEDELAAQIARPGIETTPGNHILLRPDPDEKPDLEYLRGQVHDNQIDAIVVTRVLKVDKKVSHVSSSTY